MRLAARLEEFLQEARRGIRIASARHLRAMVTGGLGEEVRPVEDRPALRVLCGEDDAGNARKTHRAGTHRARLKCYEKRCPEKPLIAESCGTRTQNKHLGMRGRIVSLDDAVALTRQHLAVGSNQHRAHRHLAACARRFGFGERHGHIVVVRHCRLQVLRQHSTP